MLPSESLLSLLLRPVTMNAGDWEPVSVQELVQLVSSSLGLHEHQSQLSLALRPVT